MPLLHGEAQHSAKSLQANSELHLILELFQFVTQFVVWPPCGSIRLLIGFIDLTSCSCQHLMDRMWALYIYNISPEVAFIRSPSLAIYCCNPFTQLLLSLSSKRKLIKCNFFIVYMSVRTIFHTSRRNFEICFALHKHCHVIQMNAPIAAVNVWRYIYVHVCMCACMYLLQRHGDPT